MMTSFYWLKYLDNREAAIEHYRIRYQEEVVKLKSLCCSQKLRTVTYTLGGNDFTSIEDLVEHYQHDRGGLCCMLRETMLDSCQDYLAPANYGGLDCFWNIAPESIILCEQVGSGHFGTVYVARFRDNQHFKMAIKFVKSSQDPLVSEPEFRKETNFMKKLERFWSILMYY